MIAEILDKMTSIPTLWGLMALLAAPFLIGTVHRKIAWLLLPVGLVLSGWLGYEAYHEAFVEIGMKESIREEMGYWWIVNELSATTLPSMVAVGAVVWQIRKSRNTNRM